MGEFRIQNHTVEESRIKVFSLQPKNTADFAGKVMQKKLSLKQATKNVRVVQKHYAAKLVGK